MKYHELPGRFSDIFGKVLKGDLHDYWRDQRRDLRFLLFDGVQHFFFANFESHHAHIVAHIHDSTCSDTESSTTPTDPAVATFLVGSRT